MESMPLLPLLLALCVFGGTILSAEIGYQCGSRRRAEDTERNDLGVVQGAVLGLLGLLLGFSFAGAAGRFVERQDLIVREANAIGTAYLRADLVPEPAGGAMRSTLREYAALRVAGGREVNRGKQEAIAQRCVAMHSTMWEAAVEGVRERPEAIELVVPAVNDVIDLHTTRLAASRRHLPPPVMWLLLACAGASLWMIGYSYGLTRRRNFGLVGTLAFVVASAIWFTIDLDYPRRGMIRLNDGPLEQLTFPDAASAERVRQEEKTPP